MANSQYPKTVSFSTTIPFDQPLSYMAEYTISGALTFAKNTSGAYPGYGTMLRLVADGSHTPDFSAFASEGPGSWVNTAGTVNKCFFYYDGSQFCVIITQPGTGGTGTVDTTAPTMVSATALDATTVRVVFSESVVATKDGWSIFKQELSETTGASSVTGSGTTWDFTIGGTAMDDTMTLKISYNSGSGNTLDGAGNELSTISLADVTNSIGGGGGATTLNAPTGVTLGTATSTTQPLTWTDTNSSPNESGYKVYYNTVNTFGSATLATTTAADATSYTVTGLTASTTYYYWVVAAGNGTTTSDSSASTVASGSTAAAGYDADATAYFTSESITDTTTKDAINALIVGLKTDNVWTSNIKGIFLGQGSGLYNARTNTAATGTNLPTVSGGNYTFDAVNDAINTGIIPNTDLTNYEAYFIKGSSFTGQSMIGSRVSGAGTYIWLNASGDFIFRLGSASDATISGQGGNGRYAIYRKSDTYVRVLKNGSSIYNNPLGAASPSTGAIAFGARNDDGSMTGFAGGTVPYLIIATNLDDTKAAAIDSRLATYLTTLGL